MPESSGVIVSIKRVHFGIFMLVVAFSYFCSKQIQLNNLYDTFGVLDKILVLRNVVDQYQHKWSPLLWSDLPRFSRRALVEYLKATSARAHANIQDAPLEEKYRELIDRYSKRPVERAYIVRSVPMRTSYKLSCDVAIFVGPVGEVFVFGATHIATGDHRIDGSKIRMAIHELGCGERFIESQSAILIELEDGSDLIWLSLKDVDSFPGLQSDLWSDLNRVKLDNKFFESFPENLRKHLEQDKEYQAFDRRVIDAKIMRLAQLETGTIFGIGEFEKAISELFKVREETANLLGVPVAHLFFIRVVPVLFFIMTFTLWRRLRMLNPRRLSSDQPWFILDLDDTWGKIFAYFYAFTPLLMGIWVWGLFAYAQRATLILFDRVISVQNLLALEFPRAPLPGYISNDVWAWIILFIGPIQLVILVLITIHFLKVIQSQLRARSIS